AIREIVEDDPPPPSGLSSESNVRPDRWVPSNEGPRFLLGAWHSEISLKRAVAEYDGWICSAFRTTYTTRRESIQRYRALGGTRALTATCQTDLDAPHKPFSDDDSYYL